jgi:hypothetical protein
VSITLAFGLHRCDDFREAWANKFPNPHASSSYPPINNGRFLRKMGIKHSPL